MNKTDVIEKPRLRDDIPDFRAGDTVKVHVRVVEGSRERIQVYQGVVIGRRGSGLRATFTVRKVSFGVGVERTFPLHSPQIAKIEVATRGDVRRAKLYYLRERRGKRARIKELRTPMGTPEERAAEKAAKRAAAAAAAAEAKLAAAEPEVEPTEAEVATAEPDLAPTEAEVAPTEAEPDVAPVEPTEPVEVSETTEPEAGDEG